MYSVKMDLTEYSTMEGAKPILKYTKSKTISHKPKAYIIVDEIKYTWEDGRIQGYFYRPLPGYELKTCIEQIEVNGKLFYKR